MTFVQEIDGCVCVNPGMLVKGAAPGSYANITINPLVAQDDNESNQARQRIRVDILNI
jgi:hypothetical protein